MNRNNRWIISTCYSSLTLKNNKQTTPIYRKKEYELSSQTVLVNAKILKNWWKIDEKNDEKMMEKWKISVSVIENIEKFHIRLYYYKLIASSLFWILCLFSICWIFFLCSVWFFFFFFGIFLRFLECLSHISKRARLFQNRLIFSQMTNIVCIIVVIIRHRCNPQKRTQYLLKIVY